jgi:ubiquinone/menaquinone biosynthesis C-methylase UbiE
MSDLKSQIVLIDFWLQIKDNCIRKSRGGMEMESYNGLAQIYDKTIEIDYDRWTKFIFDYFGSKGMELKGKKLLELGCGTGNMTLCLKEKGMEVIAVDLSQEMLQTAMEKAIKKRYKIMFVNQDMTAFEMNKKFDYIFSFCDAYNYITKENQLKDSFDKVYNHLKPGGYFVFDISTAYKLIEKIGNNTFTLNEEMLCYIWDNYVETEEELLEMYITFFVKDGPLYKRFQEQHIQKIWKNDMIVETLRSAGFQDIEIYDDYTMKEIGDTSLRAVFVCKREI